jgi:hypothetical protein
MWSIFRVANPYPEIRLPARARTLADRLTVMKRLTSAENRDTVYYLDADGVPARPDVRSVRLVSWDGVTAEVEHSGPCDLVLSRTYDPGWKARIDGGPAQTVVAVDAGFQGVRINGNGTHRVSFHYLPRHFVAWAGISLTSATLAAIVLITALLRGSRKFVSSRGNHSL